MAPTDAGVDCFYACGVRAHFWTVVPRLLRRPRPAAPGEEAWRGAVVDPERGAVPLFGWLRRGGDGSRGVVLVHGLGGSPDSPYLDATARACAAAGATTLRLGLRGCDGRAGDFYHAGLTADLDAALRSPELRACERLAVIGFSLGGHLVIRHATEDHDPRLEKVAAVCSPLELQPAQQSFDRAVSWPYRLYVLGRLKRVYAEIARLGAVPTPVARVQRVRTIREWDRLTVVPRFGFASPEDYYERASAGPRLDRLRIPALVVACPSDPMVPASSIRAAAAAAGGAVDLRWAPRGGHVAFPGDLDLGMPGAPGLGGQLAAWLVG